MKVYIYTGLMNMIQKSGIGRAIYHQMTALKRVQIPFTTRKGEDYDIVHINTVFPDAFLKAKKAKRDGKKVVYYAHSTMEDFRNSFNGSNAFAPFFKWWITRCYNSGDVIITPTEYSRELIASYGVHRPIYSLTNGIDLKKYVKNKKKGLAFREKYGLKPEDKVVISVGHYIERKGILDFVKMAERFPEYQFLWFGYTNLSLVSGKIRKVLKKSYPNLQFPGYVDKEELIGAYSGSDLFLFMTNEETEGIVMLEAMAMRIPILVRDIPIYEKWLPKDKVVYKASDTDEFAEMLPKILNGEVPDLTEAAYEVVKKNDISVVGQRLQEIYTMSEMQPDGATEGANASCV